MMQALKTTALLRCEPFFQSTDKSLSIVCQMGVKDRDTTQEEARFPREKNAMSLNFPQQNHSKVPSYDHQNSGC
jgi:hypothetical protein